MQSYGHYTFPDPGLFIHPATVVKYIELWLWVHDAWFMHVAKEPFIALSNQSWHTSLSIDNTMLEKGETKAACHCQEVLDIILLKSDMYPGVEKQSGSMGPIVWQGREYPSGVYSLEKPRIGRQWLQQALPVHHWTVLCHEVMERRQACYAGWQSLWFVSKHCHGIGEHCCEILLSTIF